MKSLEDRRNTKQVTSNTYTIAVLGSHSALEVCFGAKKQGFRTLVVVEKGRDKTYAEYFKSQNGLGCVDEVLYVDKYKDLLTDKIQKVLREKNAIFIPHRSFEVYVNDYDAIEKTFKVPMFGNRRLLRTEERTESLNQYDILKKAGIKYPKRFHKPEDIDRLVIVKVSEKERGFERAFFLIENFKEYEKKSKERVASEEITQEQLIGAVIEEFLPGVQVNFNFFYSLIHNRLELIGTDTRRQTNHEGIYKLSPEYQQSFRDIGGRIKYEEAGHIAVTVLESLLEQAFAIGESFVKATQEMFPPGVIGPFGLQAVITPGPPKKEIVVFDVSPRMPGSPGIAATPYSSYLYGRPVSMGERVAMEIKEAIKKVQLKKILT